MIIISNIEQLRTETVEAEAIGNYRVKNGRKNWPGGILPLRFHDIIFPGMMLTSTPEYYCP